jgi:hypothetical protein
MGGELTLKLKHRLEPLTLGSVHRGSPRRPALTGMCIYGDPFEYFAFWLPRAV